MRTRRVELSVVAVDTNGGRERFHLIREISRSMRSAEDVEKKFLGHEFFGQISSRDVREFSVAEIISVTFLPDRFFLDVKPGRTTASGTIRLGRNIYANKLWLKGLIVEFELSIGEGISFNENPWSVFNGGEFRLRRDAGSLLLTDGFEEWSFPQDQWVLDKDPVLESDYARCDHFRDSLPELSSLR